MEKHLKKWRKLDARVSSPHGVDEMENNKLKRKISLLEKELKEVHAASSWKIKAAKRKANACKFQLRKATRELQAVEKAFIEGVENYLEPGNTRGGCDTVLGKHMGILDTEEEWYDDLWAACTTNSSDENCGAEVKEFIKFWEARVLEPDFDARMCEEDKDGNLKYKIREDHEELNQVLEAYGPKVYEAVCNAHLQVKEHVSGATVLWHYGENRKGTVLDVVENWNICLF